MIAFVRSLGFAEDGNSMAFSLKFLNARELWVKARVILALKVAFGWKFLCSVQQRTAFAS